VILLLNNRINRHLRLARQIKYKRILALQTSLHGSTYLLPKPKFVDFLAEVAAQQNRHDVNAGHWKGALKHLTEFIEGTNPAIDEIDDIWLTEFKEYLIEENPITGKQRLSANTAHSYFNKIRHAMSIAYERNIIERNPANLVRSVPTEGTHREFLTMEELKAMVETPCEENGLKDIFLFSVLTGLRWSDAFNLCWEHVKGNDIDGWYIQFKQRKTKDYLVLPLTRQAREIIGDVKLPDERVFVNTKYSARTSQVLSRWALRSGVSKKITFHSARHTHATLLLSKGVDIYTVSKLLGHRRLKSTEQYAHLLDKMKVEAVNKLPTFDGLSQLQ
jgi:integrase